MRFTYAAGAQPVPGYTIRHALGRGGFGEVYRAVSDGGKDVALKLVQHHLDVELRGVGQCLNLKHPHLVVVYDILRSPSDDTWILMEYVAGESLEQVLARHPDGIPEPQARLWLHGLCAGVGYLHEHGIVHRDLKPGNVFIENRIVKIGDYGLSKFISTSRRSGQTVSIGSVHYMAPEISLGRYGKEVDQYALGIILYEMLTGRVPFDGQSQGEILMKHLVADPDLSRLAEPYRSMVARLLAKDPQNRYPSVPDLLAALPGLAATSPWPSATSATATPSAAADLSRAASKPTDAWVDAEADVPAEPSAAARPEPPGVLKARFETRPLIRHLAENGMEVTDIKRVIRALRQYPGQQLPRLVSAVQAISEYGWYARDLELLVRALGRRPALDVPGILTVLPTLAEHDFDVTAIERVLSALDEPPVRALTDMLAAVQDLAEHGADAAGIERVLHALAVCPTPDLSGLVTAVRDLAERDMDAKDIERVLRALGAGSKHEMVAKLATVGCLLEHDMDARDIERVVRALGEWPGPVLSGAVSLVQRMVENGGDAKQIERVLRALGDYPEPERAGVLAAVQSMLDDGMEADDIEKSIRAHGEYAG
jgi:hypothetical protein